MDRSLVTLQTGAIGIFDSGLGGLSIVRETATVMPGDDLIYIADQAWCPYGAQSPEVVRARALAIVAMLEAARCRLLVAACNTVCAVALEDIRAQTALPVVGLEPAVKSAASLSRSGKIGVLATPHTVASERLQRLVTTHANGVAVDAIAAPELVTLVERGEFEGPLVEQTLMQVMKPWRDQDIDVIVLGCTHFPFLRSTIQQIVGSNVRLVDSGEAIARRAAAVAGSSPRNGEKHRQPALVAITSGELAPFDTAIRQLVGSHLNGHTIEIRAESF